MKLICLGSSSQGNGYILQAKESCLLIEAGISLMEVKKTLDFDLTKVKGLIISHMHLDHFAKIHQFLNAGISCWIPELPKKPLMTMFLPYLYDDRIFKIEDYKIKPFSVVHDVICYGFIIQHSEMGKTVFLTDSNYSPFKFKDINHWLIEVNYDQEILDTNMLEGRLPSIVRNRVMNSHMSLQTAKELLKANDLSQTRNIVLLHLSGGNSDEKKFKNEIEELTGKPVTIANKGIEVDLSLNPF